MKIGVRPGDLLRPPGSVGIQAPPRGSSRNRLPAHILVAPQIFRCAGQRARYTRRTRGQTRGVHAARHAAYTRRTRGALGSARVRAPLSCMHDHEQRVNAEYGFNEMRSAYSKFIALMYTRCAAFRTISKAVGPIFQSYRPPRCAHCNHAATNQLSKWGYCGLASRFADRGAACRCQPQGHVHSTTISHTRAWLVSYTVLYGFIAFASTLACL